MKSIYLYLLSVSIAMVCSIKINAQSLYVWTNQGEIITLSFDEQPITTFNGDELIISTKNSSLLYDISEISKYTFDSSSTGIENKTLDNKSVSFKFDDNRIKVISYNRNGEVAIYQVDGKRILTGEIRAGMTVEIPLNGITAGTYIINCCGINYKIQKK